MLIPTESQLPLQTYQHHPEKQKNQKIKHLEAEQSNTKDVLSFYFLKKSYLDSEPQSN